MESDRAGDDVSEPAEGPTPKQVQQMADEGLFWRTCDQCAAQGVCIIVEDAYICESCMVFHNAALDAATLAVWEQLAPSLTLAMGKPMVRSLVAIAVKTYCEFNGEAGLSNEGPALSDPAHSAASSTDAPADLRPVPTGEPE